MHWFYKYDSSIVLLVMWWVMWRAHTQTWNLATECRDRERRVFPFDYFAAETASFSSSQCCSLPDSRWQWNRPARLADESIGSDVRSAESKATNTERFRRGMNHTPDDFLWTRLTTMDFLKCWQWPYFLTWIFVVKTIRKSSSSKLEYAGFQEWFLE